MHPLIVKHDILPFSGVPRLSPTGRSLHQLLRVDTALPLHFDGVQLGRKCPDETHALAGEKRRAAGKKKNDMRIK